MSVPLKNTSSSSGSEGGKTPPPIIPLPPTQSHAYKHIHHSVLQGISLPLKY